MEIAFEADRLLNSNRWLSFLDSIAQGLQMNMTVISIESDSCFKTAQVCSICGAEYPDLTLTDIKKAQDEMANPEKFVTVNGSQGIVLKIQREIIIMAFDCPYCSQKNHSDLRKKAEISGRIIADFLTFLSKEIIGGQRAVELSALRQMNQIILDSFQGQDKALIYAFNLILSALVILFDAQGSWLQYNDGEDEVLLIKGEEKAVKQAISKKSIFIAEAPMHLGGKSGSIGVLEPSDLLLAQTLIPLMAQECAIVFEIERLFELVQIQLARVIGDLGSGVALLNESKAIIYTNNSFALLAENLLKNSINMSESNLTAPWMPYLAEGRKTTFSGQMDFWCINGEEHWINWQLCPLFNKDTFCGWILLVEDVSDHYRLQAAVRHAERLEVTSTMVGALAHELRNPLSAAKGLIQLLAKRQDPAKIVSYSDLILKELDRVTSLLNEFLLLGKPAEVALQPLELVTFLTELMPLLEGEALPYRTRIITNFHEAAHVDGDSGQLTQVILNLVRNSIQAAGEAGQIILNLKKREDCWIELSVRDNGPGLPPHEESRIFDPFFSTRPRGTGLGLTVVKTIVNNHGGKIIADNHHDGGAIFTIYLPPSKRTPRNIVDIRKKC